jgi:5-methylcytosine-specific restriction endonuclease McrA
MGKVLVLNASYEPLNITSWRRAVVLLLKGKAEQLEYQKAELRTRFPIPTVIRLRYYVRVPYKEIPLTRRNILERDNHTCQYCRYKGDGLTLDHVNPRSRGGRDSWDNLVAACVRCNVRKGSRTPDEANMPLLSKPRRPYSSLHFEIARYIRSGRHQEWQKYTIGI